ncbi:conserved hypothetical protein [Mesorhizobium plurifarium]|uniref:Uncharacterized protein n=1 Tax=Mesorhizobium plurifarium TaxID=69974 RepID=A0A0K2VSW8_MESPL|nr:conserved hypothetical protein [Mesorhizobium plurifarium]
MPVLLDPRGAETGKAVFVDRCLPGEKFFGGELVALAGFFKAEQAAAHRRDHFRLAPDNPAPRVRRRQIGDRKRAAVGPNNILDSRSNQIGHRTLY